MRRTLRGSAGGLLLCGGLLAAMAVGVAQPAVAASDDPPGDGPLTVQGTAGGRVIDLENSRAEDRGRIQEWTYNATTAQQWRLSRAGDAYRIASVIDPTFCLGRAPEAGATAVLLRRCGDGGVDWQLQRLDGDEYRIKDPGADRYLREAGTLGGALLTGADGGTGARWFLTPPEVPRRPMPADPRLDQMSFLTSHNAMANSDEGFGWRFPNQSYRLRDQLQHGVRGLQIDAHHSRNDVRLCHGSCWGNERTLTAGLQDVVDFLHTDRSAVVTVFIEDYTSVAQLGAALGRVNGLAEVLLRPDRAGVRQHGWPRLSELVASGKRLLIFSQSPGREAFGVMHDRDWTVENYWSLENGDRIDCYTRWAAVPLSRQEPGFRRLHVMNHYRNIPSEPTAVLDNGAKLRNRAERLCGPAARTKPNYVAVDFYQKPAVGGPSQLVADLNTYW